MVLAVEKTIVYLEKPFRSNRRKYMIKYSGLIGNNTWCRVSKEIVCWGVLEWSKTFQERGVTWVQPWKLNMGLTKTESCGRAQLEERGLGEVLSGSKRSRTVSLPDPHCQQKEERMSGCRVCFPQPHSLPFLCSALSHCFTGPCVSWLLCQFGQWKDKQVMVEQGKERILGIFPLLHCPGHCLSNGLLSPMASAPAK